jgi:fatty acid desaturase
MIHIVAAPYSANMLLTALAAVSVLIQLFFAPLVLLPQAPVFAIVAVLLLALGTPLNRALLHEAIHGRLARRRNWNDIFGRTLAVSSGVAFDAMRFGHLAHHRFPRHELDRADVIEPGKSGVVSWLSFYAGLLGWIHFREILASAIMLLPHRAILIVTERILPKDDSIPVLRAAIRRSLNRRLWRTRTDLFLVALLYAGAFYLYGAWWPILVAGIALRALIVSVQDNVAHYGTPAVRGAPAHNSVASRWLSLFTLNANLHGVHHDRPELPWNILPDALEGTGNGYAGNYVALVLRQFRGPRRSFAAPRAVAQDGTPAYHA